uniref:VHL domain-containing protein n=1 Tax=Parastrongyloides trichosuri TaxID=131310 RepID=A0A0N4ZQD8_PARTI
MEAISEYEDFVSQGHKSPDSTDQVRVHFRNTSGKCVCLYWLDHNGREVFYTFLPSRKSVTMDSYKGHLWFVRHFHTGRLIKLKLSCEKKSSYLFEVPDPEILQQQHSPYATCFMIDEVQSLQNIMLTEFSLRANTINIEKLNLPEDMSTHILVFSSFMRAYNIRTKREFSQTYRNH